jgi:hypothetical protein
MLLNLRTSSIQKLYHAKNKKDDPIAHCGCLKTVIGKNAL